MKLVAMMAVHQIDPHVMRDKGRSSPQEWLDVKHLPTKGIDADVMFAAQVESSVFRHRAPLPNPKAALELY